MSPPKRKLPPHRIAVVEALRSKFSLSKARSYEGLIYNMCKKLSEDVYEESVEEIYRYYSYEKVGQLVGRDPKDEVIDDIKECRVGTDSYYYRKLEVVESSTDEPLIRSGVFPCRDPKCRSFKTKETIIRTEQRRSGDEGMTVIIACRVCHEEYTVG